MECVKRNSNYTLEKLNFLTFFSYFYLTLRLLNWKMAPSRVDARIEELIVRLRDEEEMKMQDIGNIVNMHRSVISRVYRRAKNPKEVKAAGRKRKTDER